MISLLLNLGKFMEFEQRPHLPLGGAMDDSLFSKGASELDHFESLGMVIGDQELLQDLKQVLGSDDGSGEQAICGCTSGCGCSDCQCLSGGEASNLTDGSLLSEMVNDIRGLGQSNAQLVEFSQDVELALMSAFGDIGSVASNETEPMNSSSFAVEN